MVIEKAKRLVEHKKDVIILLTPSLVWRALTTLLFRRQVKFDRWCGRQCPSSSETLLRCGRNVEEGGSLTIIATALIDTGLKWTKLFTKSLKVQATWNCTLS